MIKQVLPIQEDYDHIVIDTSPYFNKLTAETLKINDLATIPTLLEDDSMGGAMTTIQELTVLFGESIRRRVLTTMMDRSKYAGNLFIVLKEDTGTLCFNTYIQENRIPVRRAGQHHASLSYRYWYTSKTVRDYGRLTKGILEVI